MYVNLNSIDNDVIYNNIVKAVISKKKQKILLIQANIHTLMQTAH